MAYQGLNVEGAPLVRVMPQYTPVNTAIDLSGIGRGIEQGMGLVNQATQMRRARDLMLEEQSRRPVRDLVAEAQLAGARRNIAEAGMPIEMLTDTAYENIPGVGIVSKETISSIDPITGNKTYRDRTSKLIETEAQRNQRISNEKKQFRPDAQIVKNPDGSFSTVYINVNPGEEGKEMARLANVAVPQGLIPEPPVKPGPSVTVKGQGGQVLTVPTRVNTQTGDVEVYDQAVGGYIPYRGAVKPSSDEVDMVKSAAEWSAYSASEREAGRTPKAFLQWLGGRSAASNQVTPFIGSPAIKTEPAPTRIRVDASSVYGTP